MRFDVLIGLALALYNLWAFVVVGPAIIAFIDVMSIVMVCGVPLYLLMAIHGFRTLTGFRRVVGMWFRKTVPEGFDPACFQEAAYVAETAKRITWAMGWVSSLIHVGHVLNEMRGWPTPGIVGAINVCLLPLLYAGLINVFFWIPFGRFAQFAHLNSSHTESALSRLSRVKFETTSGLGRVRPKTTIIYDRKLILKVMAVFFMGVVGGWSFSVWRGSTADDSQNRDQRFARDDSAEQDSGR